MRVTMMGVSPRIPVADLERMVRRAVTEGRTGLYFGAPRSDKRRVRHVLRLAARLIDDETLRFGLHERGELVELFVYSKAAKSIGWWGDFQPDLNAVA